MSTSDSTPADARAAELKAEGNALFGEKKYKAATVKYTEALTLDASNAVLYCNRSACHFGQSKYLDACEDAQKAVKLDPTYVKAYARLASAYDAMGQPTRSIEIWEQAIALFSRDDGKTLTAAEKKLQETYIANLASAKRTKEKALEAPLIVINSSEAHKMPWELAAGLIPQLRATENPRSSAWVIHAAYEDFLKGLNLMKSLKTINSPQGPLLQGNLAGLEMLSNGILRDSRVFHMDDKFPDIYNEQIKFEASRHRAWVDSSPEEIIKQARTRLGAEGWDSVRPALAVCVRGLFIRGLLEAGLKARPDMAEQFTGRAIQIIQLGRREWPNVPDSDRGAIFQGTFLVGLRAVWLQQYESACMASLEQYPLETLLQEAEKFIKEVQELRPYLPQNVDPGFIYSFYAYPLGQAHATIGYYYRRISDDARAVQNMEEAVMNLIKSSEHYQEASTHFAPDDEQHLWFLKCVLDCMFNLGAPVKLALVVMRQISERYPDMKRIWANSSLAKQGRDQGLEQILAYEKKVTELLEHDVISLNDPIDRDML